MKINYIISISEITLGEIMNHFEINSLGAVDIPDFKDRLNKIKSDLSNIPTLDETDIFHYYYLSKNNPTQVKALDIHKITEEKVRKVDKQHRLFITLENKQELFVFIHHSRAGNLNKQQKKEIQANILTMNRPARVQEVEDVAGGQPAAPLVNKKVKLVALTDEQYNDLALFNHLIETIRITQSSQAKAEDSHESKEVSAQEKAQRRAQNKQNASLDEEQFTLTQSQKMRSQYSEITRKQVEKNAEKSREEKAEAQEEARRSAIRDEILHKEIVKEEVAKSESKKIRLS